MTDRWVAIGQLQGTFGVKGWMRVWSFTEPREQILAFSEWWIGENRLILQYNDPCCDYEKFKLVSGRKHRRGVVARLQDVVSPERVKELSGLIIYVPRHQLPEQEKETHYWTDMAGLQVVTGDGHILGVVASLFATGANDVLVVRESNGGERLLPFTHEVVQNVDLSAQTITVCLMSGM